MVDRVRHTPITYDKRHGPGDESLRDQAHTESNQLGATLTMAFIPDDAVDLSGTVSPSAFRLYCLICRRRNHRTGYALLTRHSISNMLQLSRGQTYRATRELLDKTWITANEPYFVPLLGDFSPVDRYHNPQPKTTKHARKNETNARKNETECAQNCDSTHINDTSSSLPALLTKQKDQHEKEICTICQNGYWYDRQTGGQLPCFACEAGLQIRRDLGIPF
jgi:hypothetical protein